jgi:hypothetical protein
MAAVCALSAGSLVSALSGAATLASSVEASVPAAGSANAAAVAGLSTVGPA